MPVEMIRLGDAIYATAGDLTAALFICTQGGGTAAVESQLDFYWQDRGNITARGSQFNWEP